MDYRDEHLWIIKGDCLDKMQMIEDESVDLWVTSPPYAKQRNYNGAASDKYIEFISPIINAAVSKMKNTGSLVINIKEHSNNGSKDLYVFKLIIHLVEVLGLRFVDEHIWVKTNPYPTGCKSRLKDGYERLLHFTKGSGYQYFPENCLVKSESKWLKSDMARTNKGSHSTTNGSGMNMSKRACSEMVRPSNVITGTTSNINIGHPAVYPDYLPEFFIKLMTKEGDTVGDMFMGSGTTGIACKNLKRKFIGIELDDSYFDIAKGRLL